MVSGAAIWVIRRMSSGSGHRESVGSGPDHTHKNPSIAGRSGTEDVDPPCIEHIEVTFGECRANTRCFA